MNNSELLSLDEVTQPMGEVALVAVEKALYSFDLLYSYIIPFDMAGKVSAGMRVLIPFGRTNKKQVGMVFSVEHQSLEKRMKKLSDVIDDEPVLSDEMLKLVIWLKENTFCTYFDAIRTVIPPGLGMSVTSRYEVTDKPIEFLSPAERDYFSLLKKAETKKAYEELTNFTLNPQYEQLLKSLVSKEYVTRHDSVKQRIGADTEQLLRLFDGYNELLSAATLTPKQQSVIAMLEEFGTASVKEVCYNCGVTAAVVKNLLTKGVIEQYTSELSRALSSSATVTESLSELVFSKAQQEVFDGLCKLADCDEPKCALLRGVTGSGKTSVFIKMIEHELCKGRTALMLVPEISLTPQTVRKFQCLFGDKVAIIHSNLSLGQRADEYKRIKRGEASIVIGTRSAVFAPLDNIGIIVIDEEGEHTYKSEKAPRYHARNVAKQRCFRHNAMLLLASATPSLESYYYAKTGRYSLFELNERYSNAVLPDVYLVDMKQEVQNGNRGSFSDVLAHELKYNFENGAQSIVLLNRRGFHTHINCMSCGNVLSCPNCNIPLTYHKINESAICHYCGYQIPMPESCPSCKSVYIHQSGTGTQKIEEELQTLIPKARILRMDADTTMTRNAFETKFGSFGNGEYDIMVGTQMIAKGLDFPNVTLVGVLLIDKLLYAGDYLGYEKTFSLVTQVVGRSGRGNRKGRAYIQTFTPEHYVLELAASQNYVEFYNQETALRRELIFPPFCDIFMVAFISVSEPQCVKAAKCFTELFAVRVNAEVKKPPFRTLGPTKASVVKVNGRYRYKLLIKSRNNAAFRAVLNDVVKSAYDEVVFENVSFYIDINGDIL